MNITPRDLTNPRLQSGVPPENLTNPRLQSGVPPENLTNPRLQSGDPLSHTDSSGRARMVDVGPKPEQLRIAKAKGFIRLQDETIRLVRENLLKKGDVLTVAEIAGIQAAKQTPALIPLCHNINLTSILVTAELQDHGVLITGEAQCIGPTGVEMEALTSVSVALLTVYDMCKAVDKSMIIDSIELIEKTKHEISR